MTSFGKEVGELLHITVENNTYKRHSSFSYVPVDKRAEMVVKYQGVVVLNETVDNLVVRQSLSLRHIAVLEVTCAQTFVALFDDSNYTYRCNSSCYAVGKDWVTIK